MRILVFGDSITEGYYDMERGGWVNMLKIYFWKKGRYFEVANCGISGDDTKDIISRFDLFLKGYSYKFQEKTIVIFSIGINDSFLNENGKNQININQFEKNINQLIRLSKKEKLISNIIFLTNINVDESKTCPVSWGNIYYKNSEIKKYNQIIKNITKKEGLTYIDLYGIMENEDLDDGIHPNTKGHKKIFNIVKEKLNTYIIK